MDKYQETFNTWNKIAEAYQDRFMNLDLYNETYDAFLDLLNKKTPRFWIWVAAPETSPNTFYQRMQL